MKHSIGTSTSIEAAHGSGTKEAVKGALLWGSVYSVGASGAAYMVLPDATASFSDILMNSLYIFPATGAARGWLMWKVKKS